jgi:hypothetical protein
MELYRLSDQSGAIKLTRTERVVRGGRANKRRLESNNAMILDDGFQIYCWIGKNASSAERGLAMAYANCSKRQKVAAEDASTGPLPWLKRQLDPASRSTWTTTRSELNCIL